MWEEACGNERALSIRAFSDNMKREAYERQKGICPACKNSFAFAEMEADHITPWSQGGRTIAANCQMLCKPDNRIKGGR
jgi:5-methylcytosine-specific restriction endonuclease McrA